jgi:hypothetical protein
MHVSYLDSGTYIYRHTTDEGRRYAGLHNVNRQSCHPLHDQLE